MDDQNRMVQMQRVYQAFHQAPKTMKEVDQEQGVMRENICWYVSAFRKAGRIFPVRKRLCKVTKHRAMAWTTNEELVPENPQLKIW